MQAATQPDRELFDPCAHERADAASRDQDAQPRQLVELAAEFVEGQRGAEYPQQETGSHHCQGVDARTDENEEDTYRTCEEASVARECEKRGNEVVHRNSSDSQP